MTLRALSVALAFIAGICCAAGAMYLGWVTP